MNDEQAFDGDDVLAASVDVTKTFDDGARGQRPRSAPPSQLLGGRFLIQSRLGQGATADVYAAFDRERDQLVALKTLFRTDATSIHAMKREFRSLAEVVHPNLVRLFELFEDEGRWFFTMELVRGSPIVAANTAHEVSLAARRATRRSQFGQLADGIAAIHAAGWLHRDLKPSNVLVTPDGRVVILDFGLIQQLGEGFGATRLGGTPAYMAPEHAAGQAAAHASDWYAFGVILYESLAGKLPFDGTAAQVLAKKQRDEAPPLALSVDAGDPELEALCMTLLAREPRQRAGYAAVSRLLPTRVSLRPTAKSGESERRSDPPLFVGRERELDELCAALPLRSRGEPALVLLAGGAGVGKTALMEEAGRRLAREQGALVLSGRCYQWECVPYKALDGVVDQLAQHLGSLSRPDLDAVLPVDIALAAVLFPALAVVPGIQLESPPIAQGQYLPSLRRRAFLALAEILRALCEQRPVVLLLDDLHWMDADSVRLLMGLLTAPGAPAASVIGTFRSEERRSGEGLAALLRSVRDVGLPYREVDVQPLNAEEATTLIERISRSTPPETVSLVVSESRGNPLYLTELLRGQQSPDGLHELSLESLLNRQLEALPGDLQAFVRAASLSPAPAPRSVLAAAAGMQATQEDPIGTLRRARLIRVIDSGGNPRIGPYHDLVRESVVSALGADQTAELHGRLSTAWLEQGEGEPDVLFTHLLLSGRPAEAAPFALSAARQAEQGFAFDRAAQFYQSALELSPADATERQRIEERMATALGGAGRGPKAAEAFLRAAELASPAERASLRWRAAEQLLHSRSEAGDLLAEAMASAGVPLPPLGTRRFLLLGRWLRQKVGWRRHFLRHVARGAHAESCQRFDLLLTAGWGLMFGGDVELCVYLMSECVALAARTGDPGRLACAAALSLAGEAQAQSKRRLRLEEKVLEIEALLSRVDDPWLRAQARALLGQTFYQAGLPERALASFELALTHAAEVPGQGSQLAEAVSVSVAFMQLLTGNLHACRRSAPAIVELGDTRGKPFFRRSGHYALATLALAQDDIAQAAIHLDLLEEGRTERDTDWFEVAALQLRAYLDMLTGRPEVHLERFERAERAHRSLISRQHYRPWLLVGYSTVLLGIAARGGPDARRRVAQARRLARELQQAGGIPTLRPYGFALEAGCSFRNGERNVARQQLLNAERSFADCGVLAYHYQVMRQRGLALGGSEGAELIRRADQALLERGVHNPERLTHAQFPGFESAATSRVLESGRGAP